MMHENETRKHKWLFLHEWGTCEKNLNAYSKRAYLVSHETKYESSRENKILVPLRSLRFLALIFAK